METVVGKNFIPVPVGVAITELRGEINELGNWIERLRLELREVREEAIRQKEMDNIIIRRLMTTAKYIDVQ